MTIEATIIADSISPAGIRLTTFQLRYPRFIHAELMTHRVFSRNASSSRAIPVEKMIAELKRDPAMPVFWGANQKGMQAAKEINDLQKNTCKNIWLNARDAAIQSAELLMKQSLHKQIANRILEPWAHINVVVTATDWKNFFTLRCHKDAQPELKELAELMCAEMVANEPHRLNIGDWHLPYIHDAEIALTYDAAGEGDTGWEKTMDLCKKVSVARCARVSYLTHDGRETTVDEDLALFDRLVGAQPLHASPAEHQATPDELIKVESERHLDDEGSTEHMGVWDVWKSPGLHGSLRGWIQYRKTLSGEFVAG